MNGICTKESKGNVFAVCSISAAVAVYKKLYIRKTLRQKRKSNAVSFVLL